MIVAALDGSNLDIVKTALPSACHAAQALVFQQHAVCLNHQHNASEKPQEIITITAVCDLQTMQIELSQALTAIPAMTCHVPKYQKECTA